MLFFLKGHLLWSKWGVNHFPTYIHIHIFPFWSMSQTRHKPAAQKIKIQKNTKCKPIYEYHRARWFLDCEKWSYFEDKCSYCAWFRALAPWAVSIGCLRSGSLEHQLGSSITRSSPTSRTSVHTVPGTGHWLHELCRSVVVDLDRCCLNTNCWAERRLNSQMNSSETVRLK